MESSDQGAEVRAGQVSAAFNWRKSSYSAYNGNCVEVAHSGPGRVGIRDSKAGPCGPVLQFGQGEWADFLTRLKAERA